MFLSRKFGLVVIYSRMSQNLLIKLIKFNDRQKNTNNFWQLQTLGRLKGLLENIKNENFRIS